MNEDDNKFIYAMIPMRGVVAMPGVSLHFDIGREKSIKAVEYAVENGARLFLSLQKNIDEQTPEFSEIYSVGTVCEIKQIVKLPGDNIRVLVEGKQLAKILKQVANDNYLEVEVEHIYNFRNVGELCDALQRHVAELVDELINVNPKLSKELKTELSKAADINQYIYMLINVLIKSEATKQELIEILNTEKQLEQLIAKLSSELEMAKLDRKISAKVRKQIDKSQKEYYLREQIRVIQEELGDDINEVENFTEKVKALGLLPTNEEKVLKEIARLAKMPQSSPEAGVIRTYIEWLLDLPWTKESKAVIDVSKAAKILDEDHYGLKKVKDRILEYIAVRKLTNSMGATILCFVGPPGVGKTSIVRSIARAVGREYVRMSLGGIRDEAEIKGHRRTYIGAMPGRIIYHMRNAGVVNPVFLLDEIDKMTSDFRGDPAASLLEVLDPEQNTHFRDHFLEIPYDLSKVMFIATANYIDDIPEALLDRMEVITLTGYTDEEKLEIAKRYLVPKRARINGLNVASTSLTDEAILTIISGYTKEAGVRNLEREIDGVLRKSAKIIVEKKQRSKSVKIDEGDVIKLLGEVKYPKDEMLEIDEIGTATGLAWTSVGGTTLNVEVMLMKGKGEIVLTGQLGDVMKESARTAISYLRANADEYGIKDELFSDYDIHIHVPEGAVPKDGPSAGITMATAILSSLIKKPVSKNVAMTGEITLRGHVLPIGGLKEKSLAAYRAGIDTIIIPSKNKKDLVEIPKSVLDKVNFIPASDIHTVFRSSIVGGI